MHVALLVEKANNCEHVVRKSFKVDLRSCFVTCSSASIKTVICHIFIQAYRLTHTFDSANKGIKTDSGTARKESVLTEIFRVLCSYLGRKGRGTSKQGYLNL